MANCVHEWQGRADGVHCSMCGLHLTPEEYHALLAGKEIPDKEKPKRGGKKVAK